MAQVKVDSKNFNPLYWHLQKYMHDENIRMIFIYGGSSAGKTYTIGQAFDFDTYITGFNHMAMRKFSVDLFDTIFTDFSNIATSINRSWGNVRVTQNRIDLNRGKVRFRGLDKSHRIQGITNYKRLYLDEITHFSYDDFRQIRKRLRGLKGQQIIASWNPIDINHWIKQKVIDKEQWYDLPTEIEGVKNSALYTGGTHEENSFVKINERGNAILIKTTYRDNYWIVGHPEGERFGFYDKHVIEDFEFDKAHNQNDYDVYANGQYGIETERLIMRPSDWTIVDEVPEGAKPIPSALDFGFEIDPTALTDFYLHGNYLVWNERIYETGLTNVIQYDEEGNPIGNSIQKKLIEIGFDKSHLIIAESAEPKSIREIRNTGYNMFAVKKQSILEGIKLLKSYKHMVTRRSVNIINEFQNYQKAVDKDGNILPMPIDKYNHAIDGGRYLLFMKDRLW